MRLPSCHSERSEGTRSAETLHGVYPERSRRVQGGRRRPSTRSDFRRRSRRKKIHRFAEILRSADSAQDDSNKRQDSASQLEPLPVRVTPIFETEH